MSGNGMKQRPASIDDIADQRYEDLIRFLRYRLADPADARDLAQEAFMRLLRRNRDEFIERPEAYLFRIAANLAYEQRLKRSTTSIDDAEAHGELSDRSTAPEPRAIMRERLASLERALSTLSPVQRAAFVLQRRDGLTYAEIAVRLDTTPHMVKKHLTAAMQRCRRELATGEND